MNRQGALSGITLSEILIALAILGIIAGFTIPKVLSNQQDSHYKSVAKEAAALVVQAYSDYQLQKTLNGSNGFKDLTPYMNYVAVDSTSSLDAEQGMGSLSCTAVFRTCLKLHNGGTIHYLNDEAFGGTGTTNAILFGLDPDGVDSGTPTGPGKSVQFWLYLKGRVATRGTIVSATCDNFTCSNPDPSQDPPWLDWN